MDKFQDDPDKNNMKLSVLVEQTAKSDNEEAELRKLLRKYDSNDDGMFDTEEVCNILGDYLKTRKTKKSLSRYLSVAVLLIAILGVSNIGTAFVANNLTKEVRVNTDGNMVSADNGALAIKSKMSRATFGGDLPDKGRRLQLGDQVDSCFCMHANHLESVVGAVADADITLTFPYTSSTVDVKVSGASVITESEGEGVIKSVFIGDLEGFIRFEKTTDEDVCTTMLVPTFGSDNGTGDTFFVGGTFVPNDDRNLEWNAPAFPIELKLAAEKIGFNEDIWDEDYDIDIDWADLTEEQKDAAETLGYNQCTWDAFYY